MDTVTTPGGMELPGVGPCYWIGTAITTAGSLAQEALGGGGGGGQQTSSDARASGTVECPGPYNVPDVLTAIRSNPAFRSKLLEIARTVDQPDGWSDQELAAWAVHGAHGGRDCEGNAPADHQIRKAVEAAMGGQPTMTEIDVTATDGGGGGGGGGVDVGSILDDFYQQFIKPGVDETRRRVEGGVAGAQAGAEARSQQAALGVSMPVIIAGLVAVVAVVWAINRG